MVTVGVSFRVHVQVPWNAPESVVTLVSPGVVALDPSYVPDVLGLRTRNADAELLRVLPGRAQDSVQVLIPDANTAASGFHDVTLVDMADVAGPPISVGDLGLLRRQFLLSVVTGMSRRQTELELMRHACKEQFRGVQTGCCQCCGTNIKHDMARHDPPCVQLPPRLGPVVAVPGIVVHTVEGHSTRLCRPHSQETLCQ